MTDLVQRLRTPWTKPEHTPPEFAEAADRIEELERENASLKESHKAMLAIHNDSLEHTCRIESALAALRRENAELRKDADRLTFIESNCAGRLLRKYKKRWSFEPVCSNYEYPVFPNLREAIDAAIKEQT